MKLLNQLSTIAAMLYTLAPGVYALPSGVVREDYDIKFDDFYPGFMECLRQKSNYAANKGCLLATVGEAKRAKISKSDNTESNEGGGRWIKVQF
ncbi:MAG: hypothetical protein M1836_001095 [Candelina mexicana]|nr:MAG: hypothetical protein M1836_001095 [Candelina mexicana]